MKSFERDKLLKQSLTPRLFSTVRLIGEFTGKQQLWREQSPQVLKSLRELAIIQSTESSSRIEGVIVAPDRLIKLMAKKTKPADRSESEIAGYRDALATIHGSHEHMPIKPTIIRQLHRDLFKFTSSPGGQWKPTDNEIIERRADGTSAVRFRCVPAAVTPEWVEELCAAFNRLHEQEALDPLLLIPAFVLDFLCIHPFRDGNGRVARLLTLLLLYQAGYEVGRYISLERIIESTKETYYESLNASSRRWHDGKHDLSPWRDYFLGVLLAAYRECEERAGLVTSARGAKRALVVGAIEHGPVEFTIKELERSCPGVSHQMVRLVLDQLRAEHKVKCVGRGPGARWRRIVP